jgi:SAM-dependent methyltransferase
MVRRDELVAAQYFAAVAGMAAMRHCLTRPSSVRARLDDVAAVVATLDEFPNNLRIPVVEYEIDDGYTAWAARYDGPNPATALDDEVVGAILERARPGVALDAACGTGRHARRLATLGHDVIAVDANEAMLAIAREKLPETDIRVGTLQQLPVDDASVDLVVCSLALTHVADLGPVLAEFGRVLRRGGRAVVSDMHPIVVTFGGAAVFPAGGESFELHYLPNLVHGLSDYVRAATAAGFTVEGVVEAPVPEAAIRTNPAYAVVPDAVRQAFEGLPFLLVWELARGSGADHDGVVTDRGVGR